MPFNFSGLNFFGDVSAQAVFPTPTPIYLQAWGFNSVGQLGLGDTTNRSSPVQVGTGYNSIASAGTHNLTLKTNGTLWAWGNNQFGKLGLGDTTNRSSPVQVGALTNWLTIAAGGSVSMGIKTDGTLWAIGGYNYFGQLGLDADTGTFTGKSSPIQVGTLTNWLRVVSGGYHCLAVKTDNTLWAWGSNSAGQLGLGDTTNRSSPVQVGTGYNSISTGSYHSLAVKTDGTLWSWGENVYRGPLGLGDTTNRSNPTQVGALTTWASVASGNYHSFAIKTNGTLWAWGRGSSGELGLNNTTYLNSSPQQVGALTTWAFVDGADSQSAAIKTDGTLWTWGYNDKGALGQGDTTDRSSPVQVGALTTWSNVSVGTNFIVAIA